MNIQHVEENQESSVQPVVAKPSTRRSIGIAAGVMIALLAGGLGYRWWHYASTHETTDDAYITGDIHPISSQVAGTIEFIPVNDNQEVQQGQLLVELDPKDYQAAVQQAQAAH